MIGSSEETRIEIDDISIYKRICGSKDKNIRIIEKILGVSIIPRGNTLIIEPGKGHYQKAEKHLCENSDFLFAFAQFYYKKQDWEKAAR